MKKQIIATLLALSSLLSVGVANAGAPIKIVKSDLPIKVLYNARKLASDVDPIIVNGTVLVPIRFVAQKFGASVHLDGKRITITKDDKQLVLNIGSKDATINGKAQLLVQPATVIKGRTLVPIRVISEGLGLPVRWDPVARFVWVGNEDIPNAKDIAKEVNVDPFRPYFRGSESMLNVYGIPATNAYILKGEDFPVIIGESVYYRMDLVKATDGSSFIKYTTTQGGAMGVNLFYLIKKDYVKDYTMRFRPEIPNLRESIDAFRIHYYSVVDWTDRETIKDDHYDKFKISDADYIGMTADITDRSSDPVLLVNPFK
ncbi:copper amine oxidase N-terminal domain-containing protein [Paenibacillus humicola]|uniref:copper amine oxidase N-terminal domain-containing protein n=1 Tax=Paenibacillus humicola TaxID=3110540 RepID=UPI00237AB23D|nr:copper amine oxidase N-terminal domain-containing protein [Paenibacillus humicola]